MKVFRISKCEFIDDLTGQGAYLYGGRWNTKGIFMLYCSASVSLSILETIVHIEFYNAEIEFCILELDISACSIKKIDKKHLPSDWKEIPAPKYLSEIGNKFILENKYCVLQVPSALVEKEFNYLINPNHKDFKTVKIISKEKIAIDSRLVV